LQPDYTLMSAYACYQHVWAVFIIDKANGTMFIQ